MGQLLLIALVQAWLDRRHDRPRLELPQRLTRLVRPVSRPILDVVQLLDLAQDPRGMGMAVGDQGFELALSISTPSAPVIGQ